MNNSWRPVVRPGLLILAISLVLGVLQGWLWSAIAPGVQWTVLGDGRAFGFATSSANAWVAIGLYVLLGIVAGILLGVLAWKARTARGTLMFGVVTLSALAGSAVAYWVGDLLAGGVDPTTVTDASVVTAPPTQYWLSMIVQPALAAATYTIRAAWNGSPTLDRPGVSTARTEEPVGATEPTTQPMPIVSSAPPESV